MSPIQGYNSSGNRGGVSVLLVGVGLRICWSMSWYWHTRLDQKFVINSKTNRTNRLVELSVNTD